MASSDSSKFTNPTFPRRASHGITHVRHSLNLDPSTLSTDDRLRLIPMPDKVKIAAIVFSHEELDTGGEGEPVFEVNIILTDDDGDTVLYDPDGSIGEALAVPLWIDCEDTQVKAQGDTKASIGLIVTAEADGPVSGALTIQVFYYSNAD